MKPAVFIGLFLALLVCPLAYGQSDLVNPSWEEATPVRLVLTAYQQNFVLDEPLRVKVTLKNESTELQILSCPAETSFAFDFAIYDKFRTLRIKRPGVDNLSSKTIREDLRTAREIRLYPGEEWSTTIDLNNWFAFSTDGRHLVQGWFYDTRLRRKIWSNPLFVNLKPNPAIVRRLQVEEDLRLEEERTVMTPEGTVTFLLQSMTEKDWESVFKYMNLDKVIPLFQPFTLRWKEAVSPEERESITAEFRDWFKKSPEYNHLIKFKIQNVVYPADPDERVVYAYVRFSPKIDPGTYLNAYSLRRRGNKWYVWNIDSKMSKTREMDGYDYNKDYSRE